MLTTGSGFFAAILTVDYTKFSQGTVSVIKRVHIVKIRGKTPANPINEIGISVTNSFSMQHISALSFNYFQTSFCGNTYLKYYKIIRYTKTALLKLKDSAANYNLIKY